MAGSIFSDSGGSAAVPAVHDSGGDREVRVWGYPLRALLAAPATSLRPGIWRSRCSARRVVSACVLWNFRLEILVPWNPCDAVSEGLDRKERSDIRRDRRETPRNKDPNESPIILEMGQPGGTDGGTSFRACVQRHLE